MYNVLIAEDEMLVRLGLKNSVDWEKFNMTVLADVSNGSDAWDIFQKNSVDILLTDIKMPRMDGLELISRIREEDCRIKIVILSCLEDFEIVKKAISYNVSDYISKVSMTWNEIESILEKISGELDNLPPANIEENLKNNKIPSFSRDLFFNIISNTGDRVFCSDKEDQYGGLVDPTSWRMILMEVKNLNTLKKLYHEKKGGQIFREIESVIQSILNQQGGGVVFHDREGDFILLYNESSGCDDPIQRVKKAVKTYYNGEIVLSFAISGKSYSGFKSAYNQCRTGAELLDFLEADYSLMTEEERMKGYREQLMAKLTNAGQPMEKLHSRYFSLWKQKVSHVCQETDVLTKEIVLNRMVYLLHWPGMNLDLNQEFIAEHLLINIDQLSRVKTLEEAVKLVKCYIDTLVGLKLEKPKYSRDVARMLNHIEKKYAHSVSMDDLSELIGLSPNYLSSQFKKEMNIGFSEYLNFIRIEKAKELLVGSNMKIYDILEQVGYTDNSYFSRVFKKQTGFSPKEYRTNEVVILPQE